MAIIRSGVLGNTRGKVGGVVGSQWKDKNYIREYVKPANPNTAAQQTQRSKMTDIVAFCKTLVGQVFNVYTDPLLKAMSGFNKFIKDNIDEFDGSPVYANITVTAGKLFAAAISSFTYNTTTGAAVFTFSTALGNNGLASDKVYAIVYNSTTELWYFASAEVLRSAGSITVTLPTGLTVADNEGWLWASRYTGSVVTMVSDSNQDQAVEP